jgi:hypothetical protein
MYIPATLLKEKNLEAFSSQNQNTEIFSNKIVSKKRSPLLFNIEAGIGKVNLVAQGQSPRARNTSETTTRSESARDLLTMIGVSRVNLPKNHSLLSSTAATSISENKNILTTAELEVVFNSPISSIDKFPTNSDPFYKLDEGNIANYNYERETMEGKVVLPVDMSQIAAGIVSLNELEKYAGQSKYFMNNSSIETIEVKWV